MQRKILRFFWQSAWQFKLYVIGILLLLPVIILMHQFLPPLVMSGILNQLAKGQYTHGDLWGSFGPTLVLFILLRFTSATFIWRGAIVLLNKLEGEVSAYFYAHIFRHLLTQSTEFYADHMGGWLVAATTRFTNAYARLAESIVMQFIPLLLSFAYATIILLPRAPLYIACLMVLSTLYLIITIITTQKVRHKSAEEANAQSTQTGVLADNLANILAIKTFAAENYEHRNFEKATDKAKQKFFSMMRTTQSRELAFSTITATITSVSMVVAVASVVLFDADIATTFLIIEYTGLLTARLWEFTISTLRTYNRSIGDATDMMTILYQAPSIKDPAKPETSRITKGAIAIKDLTFSYPKTTKKVFSNLSLAIPAGQRIGLVGHSGAGKTTFTKLLMRLADIQKGTITIDGQVITTIAQADLRQAISFVPQEPLLFHRTIRENIAYGSPAASQAEIEIAAKKAQADEFIEHLPDKYNTVVGERGVKLSGGQRQRIAIARAMLKNAPILILDEATSALDSESEQAIQNALIELMRGKTTIAIAHRLSTLQHMDRIIVFQGGKIIEDGSHQALLGQRGLYAKLWEHQSGGFIN